MSITCLYEYNMSIETRNVYSEVMDIEAQIPSGMRCIHKVVEHDTNMSQQGASKRHCNHDFIPLQIARDVNEVLHNNSINVSPQITTLNKDFENKGLETIDEMFQDQNI